MDVIVYCILERAALKKQMNAFTLVKTFINITDAHVSYHIIKEIHGYCSIS